jgi:hypothetical protein
LQHDPVTELAGNLLQQQQGSKTTDDADNQTRLDRAEGLGRGYQLQRLDLQPYGETFFYVATAGYIDDALRPFGWYKAYVVEGARFHGLPEAYIGAIEQASAIVDPDPLRQRDNIRLLWRLSR